MKGVMLNCKLNPIGNSGIVRNGLFVPEKKYHNYLFFKVSQRFNNLSPNYNKKRYSRKQKQKNRLIKRLALKGLSSSQIKDTLNRRLIRTEKGNKWSLNLVHSVIKRYDLRTKRMAECNKKYKIERSKMWIEFCK